MSSNRNSKGTIMPISTGPIPVGTPLYRALQAVAQAVATKIAKQQAVEPSPINELPADDDQQRS